jgi:hypothetical protein
MKNLSIKLLLLLLVISLFQSCEKDDVLTETEESKLIKINSLAEKRTFKIFSQRHSKKGKQILDINSGQNKNFTDLRIDTSYVEFKRFLDFESYTFGTISNDNDVKNLIVYENLKTHEIGAFLAEYDNELNFKSVNWLDQELDEILSKSSCYIDLQVFHTPPGSDTQWYYDGTNCQHMNDDGTTECTVTLTYAIDCPETVDPGDGGGGGGGGTAPPSGGGTGGGGSGGGNTGGGNNSPDDPTEPCPYTGLTNRDGSCGGAATEPISSSPFELFLEGMDLSLSQQWNSLSQFKKDQIEDFLEENRFFNLYNLNAIAFAEEVIKMWNENPEAEVDFEDRILNYLSDCKKRVLKDVQLTSRGKISEILSSFNPDPNSEMTEYNWIIKETAQNNARLAKTNSRTTNLASGNYAVTSLNTNRINSSTDLLIAQVIMHEAIHAYIVSYYTENPWELSMHTDLSNYEYGEMVSEFLFSGLDMNESQHNQFIRDNMVNNIREALKSFGQSKGYELNDQYYENLAWAGLQYTSNYSSELSASRRQTIEQMLEAERTSSNNGDVNFEGQKACN